MFEVSLQATTRLVVTSRTCYRHVLVLCQNADWIVTSSDLLSNRRCDASTLMKGHQHGCETPTLPELNRPINSRMTSLAMSSGYRHKSIQSSGTPRLLNIAIENKKCRSVNAVHYRTVRKFKSPAAYLFYRRQSR